MIKKIIGKKCFLSPISPKDAEKYSSWNNDLKTAMLMGDEGYSTLTTANIQKDLIQMQDRRFSYLFHL